MGCLIEKSDIVIRVYAKRSTLISTFHAVRLTLCLEFIAIDYAGQTVQRTWGF